MKRYYAFFHVFFLMETTKTEKKSHVFAVAPHAGAWIEIQAQNDAIDAQIMSLPMRERGLKYERDARAGTRYSRSPCGSVD